MKRGHEFTFENTYLKITPTTVMRACKLCHDIIHKKPEYIAWRREYQRKRRAQMKAKRLAQENRA